MAGHGSAPKGTRSRPRDQRAVDAELVVVEVTGQIYGPDLPDLPSDATWPDVTLAWWETWRASAQAQTFTATDWSFLLDTAVLHMEFWDGNMSAAAELRLRVAKFGATPEDRARLKLSVGDPKAPVEPKKRTPATRSRRKRVLKVVQGGEV